MNSKGKKVQKKKQQKKKTIKTVSKKKVVSTKGKKKQTRKIRYGRVFLYIVFPLVFLLLILSFVHFPIKNIFITGNSILSDQEIIELAGIADYPSIFEYTTRKLTEKLEESKYIDSVKIRKKKLKEIYIEVKENIPLLYDIYSNKTAFSDGKFYDGNDSSCVLLNYTPTSYLEKLKDGFIAMNVDVRNRISEVQYVPNDVDEERFLLTMNDGNYVYITLGKIELLDSYLDIIKSLDGKKGILYLDSGGYFEIKEG